MKCGMIFLNYTVLIYSCLILKIKYFQFRVEPCIPFNDYSII